MNRLNVTILALTLSSAAFPATHAYAQSAAGSTGSGESPRASIETPDLASRTIIDLTPKLKDGESSRDLAFPDGEEMQKSFGTRSRSKDGSMKETAPSDELKQAVEESQKGTSAPPITKPDMAEDPAFAEESRQVFGDDDRVQVTQTNDYPFNTIGQIWSMTKEGQWSICSGTLIGKRTVITAAHCLYSHEAGGWLADYEFYPGLNGEGNAPFGKFGFTEAYILEGFITNYKDFYGSVVPWDLGILILDKPAGETVGWMGYAAYDPVYALRANIVGYPGDKPVSTMWATNCDIDPGTASVNNFTYLCDTYPGSSGSAVYEFNGQTKERHIIGVNIAETATENVALRLNVPYFKWVNGIASKN